GIRSYVPEDWAAAEIISKAPQVAAVSDSNYGQAVNLQESGIRSYVPEDWAAAEIISKAPQAAAVAASNYGQAVNLQERYGLVVKCLA
ncbi:hypothetical protein FRX31_023717, partial [Thalictrum thalictroides]